MCTTLTITLSRLHSLILCRSSYSFCHRYIWEFGIPVVMKHISEPFMHRFVSTLSFCFLLEWAMFDTTFSMPVVTMHPNKKWMLCQSLDNQILCYGSTGQVACIRFYPYSSSHYLLHADRFKLHKKKLFRGHNNAGFACGITTPPDGAHHLGIACHESSLQ